MVDLETVGVRPTSGILSIGIVPFDHTGISDDIFYKRIEVHDSTVLGFTTDESTMKWWNQQNPAVREEAFSGLLGVREVFDDLVIYIKGFKNPTVWGNGATFDNVLLTNHFDVLRIEKPYSYTADRCFRTLKDLYPMIAYEKPVIAHNALNDAMAQARHASKILARIKGIANAV